MKKQDFDVEKILCRKDNLNKLQKIKELIKEKNKRENMGRRAFKKIKIFEWIKITPQYEKVYLK